MNNLENDGKSAPDTESTPRVDRREFIVSGLAIGGSLMALGDVTAAPKTPTPTKGKPAVTVSTAGFDLEEATIASMQEAMKNGSLTSVGLAQLYLERIQKLDRGAGGVNSVLELNPDALTIAATLDGERKTGTVRGPLHGIPILLKDNIDTADGMTTTAGSLALEGSRPLQDAHIVKRLRDAGAVILGKTNLSEWANIRANTSTSGWSGRGGQTRNPYALDRNPCGSSSGSAAAVSANFIAAAIGTETDGSIVCPSQTNGIVGLKPTVGLVSRAGIIPISHTQDTAGPMARTVTDVAIVLAAISGADTRDPLTLDTSIKRIDDYTRGLDPRGLDGAKIGVARDLFGFSAKVDQVINEALEAIRKLGAILVDPVKLAESNELREAELQVLLYEFKYDLNAYLASLGPTAHVRTLRDIIQFNEQHRESELKFFGQDLFLMAEAKGPLTDSDYTKALETCRRLSRTEGIDAVMAKHNLDAIVAPAGGPAWLTDLVNGDHFIGSSSSFAAISGYPGITVPAGFISGLPIGISFFGKPFSEPALLKFAYAFEQATHHRKPPKFLSSVTVNG